MLGPEYAVSGYVHHAVAHGRADKHAYRGYYKHPFERCGSGATAELRKLTASLLTPTERSNTANRNRKIITQRNSISIKSILLIRLQIKQTSISKVLHKS